MKKKECNIVTFYNAKNYGAVLQTFALKKTLSSFCHTSVYRHKNKYITNQYSINPFKTNGIKGFIIKCITFLPHLVKNIRFNQFVRKYILDTNKKTNNIFYVTGSDQVWNYGCSDFDKTYFLDFVKEDNLKNSYAASFGFDEIPEQYKEEYRKLLSNYNSITVRENTGALILKDLLNVKVNVSLDPTLLLAKEDWAAAFKSNKTFSEYILVYAFFISDTMKAFLMKLSKEVHLPIVILMPEKSLKGNLKGNVVYKHWVSPSEWVNYFLNASYVVTNSFHGTAFSINFNKPFFVELLPQKNKVNSRITDILKEFDLTERIINEKSIQNKEIDFNSANVLLENKRKESMEYLRLIVESYNE